MRAVLTALLLPTLIGPVVGQENEAFAPLLGKPMPAFPADFAVNGEVPNPDSLRGQVVVLTFFAPWCPHCRNALPTLKELHSRHQGKGLTVVALTAYHEVIDFDPAKGQIKRVSKPLTKEQEQGMLKTFLAHHQIGFLVLAAPPADFAKATEAFKVEQVPQVVVIDRSGKVRGVKVGDRPEDLKAVGTLVDQLLAERYVPPGPFYY